jgi:hypothetical protein
MSEIDDVVFELGASLAPAQRRAFESAAREVLAATNCSGCGAAYRVLGPLQRGYWDPPPDDMRREGARHRPSKLIAAPALGEDSSRCGERDRARLKVVG